MLVLDTDTFSELQWSGPKRDQIVRRIEESGYDPAITIVTVEEAVRGWINKIARGSQAEQIGLYKKLGSLIEVFKRWTILPYDEAAAAAFIKLKHQWPQLGASDLKIAAIVLGHEGSQLLTGNINHFVGPLGPRAIDWRTGRS